MQEAREPERMCRDKSHTASSICRRSLSYGSIMQPKLRTGSLADPSQSPDGMRTFMGSAICSPLRKIREQDVMQGCNDIIFQQEPLTKKLGMEPFHHSVSSFVQM
jgi:hypothetical protein